MSVEVERVVQVQQLVLGAQGFPPPPCLPPVLLCLSPAVRRVPLRSRRPSNFRVAAVEVVVEVQVPVVVLVHAVQVAQGVVLLLGLGVELEVVVVAAF